MTILHRLQLQLLMIELTAAKEEVLVVVLQLVLILRQLLLLRGNGYQMLTAALIIKVSSWHLGHIRAAASLAAILQQVRYLLVRNDVGAAHVFVIKIEAILACLIPVKYHVVVIIGFVAYVVEFGLAGNARQEQLLGLLVIQSFRGHEQFIGLLDDDLVVRVGAVTVCSNTHEMSVPLHGSCLTILPRVRNVVRLYRLVRHEHIVIVLLLD